MIAAVLAPRRKRGKEIVDALRRPFARARGYQQVLLDSQRRKDLALLRHERNAETDPAMRRRSRHTPAGETDLAGAQQAMSHDRREQGRLADAVATQYGERSTGRKIERDAVEHDRL